MKSKAELSPFSEGKSVLNVLVESPRGSRNKYAYDPDSGFLTLKKVLPCGMVFPFDFGAIPGTRGEDGDPLDILVLMENSVCPLCLVQAHLLGVLQAEQTEEGQTERNDRLIAIAIGDTKPDELPSIKKLDPKILEEIERFFTSYNDLTGKEFRLLGYKGPKTALEIIKQGRKKYQKVRERSSV